MSWFLAFAGFAALIVLHEFGHFIVAKAVGMRVERFMLFFPPVLWSVKRGETEYGIGAIPLGGYVRISGMNPREELPPEVEHRAYYRQAPWKRIVVILAGPAMNILIAFGILWAIFVFDGQIVGPTQRRRLDHQGGAVAKVLQPGDRLWPSTACSGDPLELRADDRHAHLPGRADRRAASARPRRSPSSATARRSTCDGPADVLAGAKRPLLGFGFGYDKREAAAPARRSASR